VTIKVRVHCSIALLALMLPAAPSGQTTSRPPAPPAAGQTVVTATASIRGRVVDTNGIPIRSAEVRLNSTDGRDHRVTGTDPSGQYEIRDLTPGQWTLKASKAGYVSQSSSQSAPFDQVRPIAIANGQRLSTDVVLSRAAAIAGRIVDEAGDPMTGVQVMALRVRTIKGRRQLSSTGVPDLTDDTGAFRLFGLPPGSYYVGAVGNRPVLATEIVGALAKAPEFLMDEIAFYYPGTRDIDLAQTIEVTSGVDQGGISITAPPPVRGVTVSGVILNASGLPAARPVVHVVSSGAIVSRSMTQGLANATANGRFTIKNLPPGEYVVDAEIATGNPDAAEHGALTISVGASDLDNVVVTTTRARTIRGTIVSDSSTALPRPIRVAITIESPERVMGGMSRVELPSNGDFTASGIIGLHSIRIESVPPGWMVRSVEIAGHDITSGAFDFSTVPPSATLRVVLTDRIGEVTGQVISRTRQQASVVVFPDDESKWQYPSRLIAVGRADEQGQYVVSGLLANARYRAVAVSYLESEEAQDPEFLKRMLTATVPFELRDGEKKTLNLLLLQR
jgi:hypothetical protein